MGDIKKRISKTEINAAFLMWWCLYIIIRYKAALAQSRLCFYALQYLLRISELCERMQKVCKKVFRMFGGYVIKQYFCTRFRERNADELKYWNEVKVTDRRSKKLFWKFLLKSFGSSKIVLTFASAFQKKVIKKSSLKDLDMNKQVVQDYLF